MRRERLALATFGSVLILAGCTATSDEGPTTPSPTASSTSPTPATPVIERRALMSYPDEPTTAWTFTAQDSGVAAEGDLTLVDPATIVQVTEGFPSPAPIDAGDTLVMAVRGDGPATLVGVDVDTGTAEWTYAPASGQLYNCARVVLGDVIACAAADPADPADALVVLIDPETGQEVTEVGLPGMPLALTVGAGLVVALTTQPDPTREGEPHPYGLTAFDAEGEQAWSTDVEYTPTLGRGPSLDLGVGESLTALELAGSVYVLTTDDGELVAQRDISLTASGNGRNWAWAPLGDAVLLYDDNRDGAPSVIVVGADGAELATLAGDSRLGSFLADARATFLQAPDGQIARVDPSTGETEPTGVTPGGDRTHAASEIGGALLVQGAGLTRYDLDNPDNPAWEQQIVAPDQFFDAATDGSLLYAGGLAADDTAADGALVLSALDLADGSLQWSLTTEPAGEFDVPTVTRGAGRLIVMNGDTMTALEP